MNEIELFAEVALLRAVPEQGLVCGQVGTVVEILSPGVAQVEFADDAGRVYVRVELGSADLTRLHSVALARG